MERIWIKDDVVLSEFCSTILSQQKMVQNAKVFNSNNIELYKPEIRNCKQVVLSDEITLFISKKFQHLIPELSDHFDINLKQVSPLQYLKYGRGHFFKLHKDTHQAVSDRQLTALLYLNNSVKYSSVSNVFEGGELIVYGVHEKFPNKGLPISAKTGRMVVFRSELFHEVKTIISGERHCIAAWYSN